MPSDFRIALLVLGAVLLLAALFGDRVLPRPLGPSARTAARAALGVVGAALIGWIVTLLWSTHPIASAAAPVAATADPDERHFDLIGPASTALGDCPVPAAPAVPDGATATLKQMTEARAAFSAYDAATNNYTQCVDEMVTRVTRQAPAGTSKADLKALSAFAASAHNTAVDQEQAFADHFNTQVRAYNAKHPKP
jgi:hypothetical protein